MTISIKVEALEQIFQEYLNHIEAGETIVLTRKGIPVAEITPTTHEAKILRPYGLSANSFVTPDNFNDPLPEELLASFEGK